MTMTNENHIKRELQKMNEYRSKVKALREETEGNSMPDVIWLRLRLDTIIRNMDIRICALKVEIDSEEQERGIRGISR